MCVCVMFLMQRSGMSDLYLPLIIQYEETSYAHEICWLVSTGKKKEMRLNKTFFFLAMLDTLKKVNEQ